MPAIWRTGRVCQSRADVACILRGAAARSPGSVARPACPARFALVRLPAFESERSRALQNPTAVDPTEPCSDAMFLADPRRVERCDWRGAPFSEEGATLYATGQFQLDWLVLNRVLECSADRVSNRDLPLLHYVPYPVGELLKIVTSPPSLLKILRSDPNRTARYNQQVKATLAATPAWQRCGGCDHMMTLSRIAIGHHARRPGQHGHIRVGSPAAGEEEFNLDDPFWTRVHKLSVEALDGEPNLFGVPYPSYLHPNSDAETLDWQRRMLERPRPHLLTLVSGFRRWRAKTMDECAAHPLCNMIPCIVWPPGRPTNCTTRAVMRAYASSQYCLHPRGDTPTRKAVFDGLLAGCIPVLLDERSVHYPLFAPLPHIAANGTVAELISRLRRQSDAGETAAMREQSVHSVPRLVYSRDWREEGQDALGVAVQAILNNLRTQ